MWRRFHFRMRAIDSMGLNSSHGSPYGGQDDSSKNMVENDKVVFVALGAFFGLMFLLFGIQIYVRCIWRRIQTEVIELEEETEEMARTEIYIREIGAGRRNWRRRLNNYFDERSDRSSPAQHIPIGLDKSVLELLPTFVFSTETACRDEMVCAVCLEEFVDRERGRLLPKCSHYFHVQCIDMWFLSHSSCPLCRCEVSLPSPDVIVSHPLLQDSQTCPPNRSLQQQQPSPPPSMTTEIRDPVSSSLLEAESASIVGAHDSNDALYLERGSSLSRRAAAIALEISEHECNNSVAEEDRQMLSSGQQPDQVKLVTTPGSSSDNPSSGSRRPYSSPRSVLCLEYQPELHPSTSAEVALLREDTTIGASSSSIGSPRHARKRSYLAVEIMGEYQLDASGAMSQIDSSSINDVRLQPT